MALDSLVASVSMGITWQARKNITGSVYSPISNPGNISKSVSLGTAAANAAANGSDCLISYIVSLAGGASATIDLTAVTDILNQASQSLARLKGVGFRLLSATDDPSNGTAATSVTIGAAATDAQKMFLADASDAITLLNGEFIVWGTPSAAGKTVDASNKNIKILNNDGSVTAKVEVTFIGGTS